MYNFHATAVILYVMVLRPGEGERLPALVDKSLEIFTALNASSVAHKCAVQTQEILATIKSLRLSKAPTSGGLPDSSSVNSTKEASFQPSLHTECDTTMDNFSQDDFLNRLMGPDMLEMFSSNTEHLGWSLDSPNPNDSAWSGLLE